MSEETLVEHAKNLLVKVTDSTMNSFVENTVNTSLQAIQKAVTPKGFMRRLCYKEQTNHVR